MYNKIYQNINGLQNNFPGLLFGPLSLKLMTILHVSNTSSKLLGSRPPFLRRYSAQSGLLNSEVKL